MNPLNHFTITGPIAHVDVRQSKAGKDILTIVLDIDKDSKYPQTVPIKVFGQLANDSARWRSGVVLEIEGRLGGRDWNGKVYGDNVAESVKVVEDCTSDDCAPDPSDDETPF